jgi:hypothetical protein
MQTKDPLESLNQKEKTHWSTSWVGLLESKVSTQPIVLKTLSVIPENKVMSM